MTNVTASGNKANNGGVIYASGSANVTVNSSEFSGNTAGMGGAVYLDLGATADIRNSTLDGNKATNTSTYGGGGAIYVADSATSPVSKTTLIMDTVTIQNNTSAHRGGAIATDDNSPYLVIDVKNCTFYKNSSTTSGGAVNIQCGNCNSADDPTEVKIVFTNCTFTENSTKTDGGAMDIRAGSCAKIDGITATSNSAENAAGVVYVTSNNSRLYLTGEVNCSGNTAKVDKGPFAFLNNSSYSNPPKIYTTHSNTADWYADVAGSRGNVVFSLTELP